ncbi:hypothetical protein [Streptomyces sp. WMMC897]|uniref:hypothetical protein n=1 Tax=Streptomyces sp. WMMC897 TaxID=3014782 RepID=UPI0022B6A32A|nr:hypothetical protein [Streptomyces sp. WMMC897]MCZ7415790.1 hypothetical protein [Streptomyces sp. WMMC897]
MEDADPARVALMCVFHDTQETRVSDIPHIGRRYLTAASNEQVTADQLADAHPSVLPESPACSPRMSTATAWRSSAPATQTNSNVSFRPWRAVRVPSEAACRTADGFTVLVRQQ